MEECLGRIIKILWQIWIQDVAPQGVYSKLKVLLEKSELVYYRLTFCIGNVGMLQLNSLKVVLDACSWKRENESKKNKIKNVGRVVYK